MNQRFTLDIKTGILFLPLQLIKHSPFINLLTVTKAGGNVQYSTKEFLPRDISTFFPTLPKPAKEAITALLADSLKSLKDELVKKHKQQKSGVTLEQFIDTAYTRQVQSLCETVKPFLPLLKCYHQLPNPATGNLMIAPCQFSNHTPSLSFSVQKENETLSLQTFITINGIAYELKDFRRFAFLIESKNEYFILKNKDYQTLEWIIKNVKPATDAALFAKTVVAKLEENYTVERNNHFETNLIENILPHNG